MTADGESSRALIVRQGEESYRFMFPPDRDIGVLQIPLSLRARLHYHSTILLMTRPQGDA